MNKKLVAGIITLVLVLSACQLLKNTTTAEPATPTLTPDIETATNTRHPTKTVTAIPPTETPDVRATQTQFSFTMLQADMDSFPIQCAEPDPYRSLLSPKKTWLATQCDSIQNRSLEILNQSGQRWSLSFSDYIPAEFSNGDWIPLGGLVPVFWSNDDRYLYYSSYIHTDGGGACNYGMGDQGLFRIDITNGKIETILPLTSEANFYYHAFSPNGRWLAYGIGKPNILDLQTGETIAIKIEGDFGNLTWSPDSSKLAFATCQYIEDEDRVDISAIKYFDMDSRDLTTIIEEKNRFFVIYTSDDQEMEILSQDAVNYDNIVEYYYDWSAEELTQNTLTPTPMQ